MTTTPDRTELVEALRRAMEELSEPGLTLGRARDIRPRVHRILGALRGDEPRPGPRGWRPGEG